MYDNKASLFSSFSYKIIRLYVSEKLANLKHYWLEGKKHERADLRTYAIEKL